MKKTKLIVLLILLIVFMAIVIYWTFTINIYENRTTQAIGLVKQKIDHQTDEIFHSCVYDESLMIVSLNHHDYFIVKGDEVRIYDQINEETKSRFPNFPIDDEFTDIYWVLENCQ